MALEMLGSSGRSADIDQIYQFLANDTNYNNGYRGFCQRQCNFGIYLLALIPSSLVLAGLYFLAQLLRLTGDGDHRIGTVTYVIFVVQPIAGILMLLSHRITWRVLPDATLSEDRVARFLLTGHCCFGDGLLQNGQVADLMCAQVLVWMGIMVGMAGGITSSNVLCPPSEGDDNMAAWFFVWIAFLLMCVVWYYLLRKLWPSHHDAGYEPKLEETVADTELV